MPKCFSCNNNNCNECFKNDCTCICDEIDYVGLTGIILGSAGIIGGTLLLFTGIGAIAAPATISAGLSTCQHSISKWWNKEQTQTIELVGEAALGGLAGSISGGFGKVGEVIILTTCKKEISKFAVRVTVRTTGKVVATTTTSLIKNGTVTREELVESALSGAVLGAGTHLFHLYHDIPSHDSPPEDFPRELCHNKLPESHLLHTTDQIYNEDIHFKNIETYADIPTSFTNSTRESTRSIDDKKADMNIISEDQVQLMKKTI